MRRDRSNAPAEHDDGDSSAPADGQDDHAPKTASQTYWERIKAKKDKNERAARGYLWCAQKARDRQRQKEADGTSAPARAWRRLTGTESADSARWRREAAADEAACARRAVSTWASHSTTRDNADDDDDDDGEDDDQDNDNGIGPAPDTAAKNAHRGERYERLVRALGRDRSFVPRIDRAVIERYPWCVDMHLNAEEDDMRRIAATNGRLWSAVYLGELPVVRTTKMWTDFRVGVCISDHDWRDHLAGIHY